MARPCVGCGFTVDNNGSLVVNGISNTAYPYNSQTGSPQDIYCDSVSNELWVKPWATAWGVVARKVLYTGNGAAMSPGTAFINTNLDTTISFTPVVNRMYKHTVSLPFLYAGAATVGAQAYILTSGEFGRVGQAIYFGGTGYGTWNLMFTSTETAGTKAFKIMVNNPSGVTGTITTLASNGNPFTYIIEDIGPAI